MPDQQQQYTAHLFTGSPVLLNNSRFNEKEKRNMYFMNEKMSIEINCKVRAQIYTPTPKKKNTYSNMKHGFSLLWQKT